MRILASYFCIDTLRLWRLCVTILSHSHDVQRSNERTNFQLKTAKQQKDMVLRSLFIGISNHPMRVWISASNLESRNSNK